MRQMPIKLIVIHQWRMVLPYVLPIRRFGYPLHQGNSGASSHLTCVHFVIEPLTHPHPYLSAQTSLVGRYNLGTRMAATVVMVITVFLPRSPNIEHVINTKISVTPSNEV